MNALADLFAELWAERHRVGLVVVGVFWGTLSLAILVALGSEMTATTTETSRNFGPGLLRVGSGVRTTPFQGLPAGEWVDRVPEDVDRVRAVPGVAEAAAEHLHGGNPIEYAGRRLNAPVVGCGPAFGDLRWQRPQRGGRFLNARDVAERRRVIFLGWRTGERLFGAGPAVGSTVTLLGVEFTVVGVLRPKQTTSSYAGEERDKVCIPATTFRDLFGWRALANLWVRFEDPGDGPADRQAVVDAVFRALARRAGIHPDDRTAIWMMDYVEIEEMVAGILAGLRIFTACVGIIGILVALVAVANVTYVLVEERTREIGVQMALGARPRDVFRERLLEGALVSLAGGAAGVAAAALVLAAFNRVDLGPEVRGYLGHPVVSLPLGALVVAALVAGGLLAGWVPARRAATVDPVMALREE